VRFEPTSAGTVHFRAMTGSRLRLLGERDGWVQVARPDGLRGWVERDAVASL
jgi:SH3-like domain-containing protein